MKRLAIFGFWFLLFGGTAYAEEAVGNNPPVVVSKVAAVVNALGPGFDELYSVRDGEWKEGVSASLWNFQSKSYHLASLRLGYGHGDNLVYNSVRLDLPGLSHRFVPPSVRGVATTGYLNALWVAVGKYGSVGPFVGYAFDEQSVDWGVTLGGQLTF